MDEQSFDNFIKDKLDHYEDPLADESAFADFRSLLTARDAKSWSRFSTAIIIASATLFTVVNIFVAWHKVSVNKAHADHVLSMQNSRLDSLSSIIMELRHSLAERSSSPDMDVNRRNTHSDNMDIHRTRIVEHLNHGLFLDTTDNINSEGLTALLRQKMVVIKGNRIFLNKEKIFNHPYGTIVSQVRELSPVELQGPEQPVAIDSPLSKKSLSSHADHKTSAKFQNALEKHYFKGLGISVGAHVDGAMGFFRFGDGQFTPRVGLAANWIISPRLSIETSVDYATAKYTLRNNYDQLPLTTYDTDYGNPTSVVSTTRLLSAPVGIKYRQWLSEKNQFFIKAGYSPYFSIGSQYETSYTIIMHHGYDADDTRTISQLQRMAGSRFYGGTGSLTVGLTRNVFAKNKLDIGFFYERSLGTVGIEKNNLQLIGLRTAFWWKVM